MVFISRSSATLWLFYLYTENAHCRHVHRKPAHVHRHIHRADPSTTVLPTLSPTTTQSPDLNYVVKDLDQVEMGLAGLSSDITGILAGLQQQIQSLEAVISSQSATVTAPASPTSSKTYTDTNTAASTTDRDPTESTDIFVTMGQAASSAVVNSALISTTSTSDAFDGTSTSLSTSTSTDISTSSQEPSIPISTTFTSSNGTSALFADDKPPSTYKFQPDAQDNVAVYYGQSSNTKAGGLSTLCANANVDIVLLAFVNDFFYADGYPGVNFGPSCDPPNAAQTAEAPGLLSCPRLGSDIQTCQKLGKPVLVSLGGWGANTSFVSDAQATQFAGTLWNLFGAGTMTPHLRPFGPDVVVDGFDIDNEDHSTAYYGTFATALRAQFSKDKSKRYYLSAAPQCPIPDESIPMSVMTQADFIWVQFYNNPSCNLDSAGFSSSFEKWSSMLAGSSHSQKPRIFIGAGAFAGAGSGYVAGNVLRRYVGQAKTQQVGNIGGIMLWDGDSALANVDQYERNYLQYAKAAVM